MSVTALKQAVAPAKEKPTTIAGFLDTYKSEIAKALPHHMTADRMARVALTECRKNPALMRCDPASLLGAVIQASQLGLEPGGALGHCYLLPFENRKKGITEVQFLVGYRGMIDLARRSGQIISIEAHAVFDGDQFECEFGLDSKLRHVPDWHNGNRTDPSKMRFVYAVAKLKDGGVQFEVMSRAEVDAIRARSKSASSGPWTTDYIAMALKTVIRRLFKYLPVSIELQQAVSLDEQVDANLSQGNEYVITGEIIEDEPKLEPATDADEPAITYAMAADAINKAKTADELDAAADLIRSVKDAGQRDELGELLASIRNK
jgi:recombination protein RecT